MTCYKVLLQDASKKLSALLEPEEGILSMLKMWTRNVSVHGNSFCFRLRFIIDDLLLHMLYYIVAKLFDFPISKQIQCMNQQFRRRDILRK